MITNKTTAKAVVIITVAVLCDKCVHFVFSPFNSLSSLFVITRMSSRMKLLFLMLLFFFLQTSECSSHDLSGSLNRKLLRCQLHLL